MCCAAGLCIIAGCTSQSIQERFSDRLASIEIGMPATEFMDLFPKAYVGGQTTTVTAYVIKSSQYAPFDSAAGRFDGVVRERLHFYFRDGKLTRWGQPGDWEADLDIQIRHR